MADTGAKTPEFGRVYQDTNYFINAIISDYSFYGSFIDAVKHGGAAFEFKRKKLNKEVDDQWVDAIEACLPALDTVIRKPSKSIEEREEVMPIELSHNITSRSLQHLAQHTDFIQKIEGDMITPNKILNVFHDETMQTYENKFINTLIQQLYIFVNRRYMQMKDEGESATSISMDFNSEFKLGKNNGKIRFYVEMQEPNDVTNGVSMSERISKLNSVATMYINSDFAKAMGKAYVRPPIMRTNAITKNKDLRQCLTLWEFLSSYDKIGYKISVEESAEKPNDTYINDLYSLLSLQYMMFRYNLEGDFTDGAEVIDRNDTEQPLEPTFKSNLQDIRVEDYNVYDSEYRKVVPVSSLSGRRLSPGEVKIREAVDVALAAEKYLEDQRKAEERRIAQELKQKQKEEEARIKQQQREEEARQKAEELRRKKIEEKKLRAKLARRKPGRPKRRPKKKPANGTNQNSSKKES